MIWHPWKQSKYFSHWNTDGVKPYVTYTQHDGRAYVKENIAAYGGEIEKYIKSYDIQKEFQPLATIKIPSTMGALATVLNEKKTLFQKANKD